MGISQHFKGNNAHTVCDQKPFNFVVNPTQVLTKEEFVHLPPGEVDSPQDAEQDNEYIQE